MLVVREEVLNVGVVAGAVAGTCRGRCGCRGNSARRGRSIRGDRKARGDTVDILSYLRMGQLEECQARQCFLNHLTHYTVLPEVKMNCQSVIGW